MVMEPLVPSGTIPVMIDTSPLPGKTLTLGQRRALRFEWPAGAVPAAAAFRRDGNLWLVFDRPPPGDLAGQTAKAAPELEPVAQFEIDGATVLRIAIPGLMTPRLLRDGSTWILNLDRSAPKAEATLEMFVKGGPGQVHASFAAEAPGRVVSFVDPVRGDRLIVATLSAAGAGTPITRDFPQFRTLASYQGLVVQPLSDTLRVTATAGAIELRDDEGLIVSRGGSLAMLKANRSAPLHGPRLFDLETWRRGDTEDFAINKHKLLSAIGAADPEQVSAARLELATFFFAHGLSTEAMSMVRLSQAGEEEEAIDPRAHLIIAAAEFLTEDYTTAAEELFHPALAGEREADLWRAALAAASQDWELATASFASANELIDAYPQTVRARLRLLAAEASLAVGDKTAAEGYLEAVRLDNPNHGQEAQVAYLVARGLYLEGDTETAAELWRRVASSKHASSRIRARLSLLDLALEDGSISADDAIDELERLRFAWRGDRFEFALLQRLGDLYIQKGSYRQGLRLLRRAAANTSNPELSMAVAARMSAVFTGLFYKSRSDLPPLLALTLFEEFKELTPPGEEGDAVILNLAERLVEIDLLDRAAGVLETQVEFRLKGQARARVAARLARIHLLGQKPVQALAALDVSKTPDLPVELTLERQRLRAQALLDLEREEEALVALGAADDPDSLRLRARILWREKNWSATVMVLERLVPRTPPELRPLREEESKAVVDLLVALTMADEPHRIRSLGKAYQEAMSRGPHAHTFRLLAGDPEANQNKTVEEELAGVADIEAFMASYHESTPSAKEGAAQ
jgi:predicted negative regulator of RcsB-dependent stress response